MGHDAEMEHRTPAGSVLSQVHGSLLGGINHIASVLLKALSRLVFHGLAVPKHGKGDRIAGLERNRIVGHHSIGHIGVEGRSGQKLIFKIAG